VFVVQRNYYRKVFLDSGHEELEKSSAFVLVAHFVFELRQQGLKLLRGVKSRHLTSRNQRV